MANLSCGRVRHASIAPTVHTASAESFRYKSPALSDKPLTPENPLSYYSQVRLRHPAEFLTVVVVNRSHSRKQTVKCGPLSYS